MKSSKRAQEIEAQKPRRTGFNRTKGANRAARKPGRLALERPVTSPRIMHITNCGGGGVPVAISAHAELADFALHHVLWPATNGENQHLIAIPHGRGGTLANLILHRREIGRQYDWIFLHSTIAGIAGRILLPRSKTVYQPHGYFFERAWLSWPLRTTSYLLEKLLAHGSRETVTLSPRETELTSRLRGRPGFRISNTCGSVQLDEHERQPIAGLFVTAGRIARQKDPLYFAATVREIRKLVPNAEFIWIGDGDEDLRRELLHAGVKVTGWLPADEARARMARASMYIHTAIYEGSPLSVIEAANSGVPIVVRATPSFAGTSLHSESTPERLARAAIDGLPGGRLHEQLAEISKQIVNETSHDFARGRLRALYDLLTTNRTEAS